MNKPACLSRGEPQRRVDPGSEFSALFCDQVSYRGVPGRIGQGSAVISEFELGMCINYRQQDGDGLCNSGQDFQLRSDFLSRKC